jgi:hypothetical protein
LYVNTKSRDYEGHRMVINRNKPIEPTEYYTENAIKWNGFEGWTTLSLKNDTAYVTNKGEVLAWE